MARSHRLDTLARIAASWLLCALALGPVFDRHDGEDLGLAHERSAPVAANAVHGRQSAHFDAAAVWVERHCSACLFQTRNLASTWRPLPALERPPVRGSLVGGRDLALLGAAWQPERSRAPPRLA